jgi:nucleolar complex protein 2
LKGLQETDPEFFKFLQKNDTSLLEFGGDDESEDDDDMDDDMDMDEDDLDGSESDSDNSSDAEDDESEGGVESDDDEDEEERRPTKKDTRKRIEITVEMVEQAAEKALASESSLTDLKKLLSMFRTACIPTGESDLDERSADDVVSRYIVPSADIYEKVMLTAIETAHLCFAKALGLSATATPTAATLAALDKHPRWKKLQLVVVSYFKSIMHTLAGLVDSSKQNHVSVFLVNSLERYVPFLAPLPRLAKNVVKVLLNLWAKMPDLATVASASVTESAKGKESSNSGSSSSSSGLVDHLVVRSHAFLRIRQIAMQLPGALTEECFRSMYLKFARQCKSYNELTAPSTVFMMQSVAELYGADLALAYQQAFLYIRQLALHLRAALLKKSDETTRQITSMQYLNCIRLWTKVICNHPSEADGLGALAFPLVQVIFGTISAVPSIYYTPLKFNLTTCLHQLAAACELFIPTTTTVIEVLEHPDLLSKPTPSTDLAPKLEQLVRLPANSVGKAVVRDAIVQECMQLVRQDLEVYRYHVGLPEYCYLTIRKLKSYLKKCKITRWRDQVRNVTGLMEQYSASVQSARRLLTRGPMSVTEFEPLLPAGAAGVKAAVRLNKLLSGAGSAGAAHKASVTFSDLTKESTTGGAAGAGTKKKAAAAAGAKDLFASSYSSIKADQIKAANKAKQAAKMKAAKDAGDSDDGAGGDDDDEDEESEEGEAGQANSDDEDDDEEDAEEMDEDDEQFAAYGNFDGDEEEEGDEFEVMSGSDDEEEEEAPVAKKGGKKQQETTVSTSGKTGNKKSSNDKKFSKKSKAFAPKIDPSSIKDSVSALNWMDDDE